MIPTASLINSILIPEKKEKQTEDVALSLKNKRTEENKRKSTF